MFITHQQRFITYITWKLHVHVLSNYIFYLLHALHILHVLYFDFASKVHVLLHGDYILDVIMRGILGIPDFR